MESKSLFINMPESKLLLDILNNRKPLQTTGVNLDKLIALVRQYNLEPIVFYRLKDTEHLPEQIYAYLRARYIGNISRNLRFWNEFLKIQAAFRENNLSILPLKGIDTLARFYPYFDLRSMCDIDILVRKEQFARAEIALSNLGYQKNLYGFKEEYLQKKQNISFYKDRILVEVHWGLDFKRGGTVMLPRLWERTKLVEAGNHQVTIFSPEDALFSFALHWRHFGNVLSLKQVFDVARIIKETPKFDWDYILKEGKRGKMNAAIYFILMQVRLFTGTDIPGDIFRKLSIPSWQKILIKKFLLKYTFERQPSIKKIYLQAHFLLYDNVFEPILYLINISYEEFYKFYNLKPCAYQTNLLYNLRLLYMPVSIFLKREWNPLGLKAGVPSPKQK